MRTRIVRDGPNVASASAALNAPTYDIKAHMARVAALHKVYPLNNVEACQHNLEHIVLTALGRTDVSPSKTFITTAGRSIRDILRRENIYCTNYEPLELRSALNQDERIFAGTTVALAATNVLANVLIAALDGYCPQALFTSSEPGIAELPLIELLRRPHELVEVLFETFDISRYDGSNRTFPQLHVQLFENLVTASGYTMADFCRAIDENRKVKLVRPMEATETSPTKLAETYLANTPLKDLLLMPVPFSLPDETRFSGHWIIAPPGRGKTTLLHAMFLDDLPRHASIIVMDSKGDLINPIKSMAALADRLVLIEPDVNQPLALNPFDVSSENVPHAIALIEYILSGLLDAKFTNLQTALFRHVLPALLQAFSNPTIETLKRVLADGLTRDEIAKLDSRLRQFFENKTSGFHSKTYAETRNQIIWRLDFILTNDTMRAMFASPTTRLKIGEAMDTGKIVLIDASKAKLGDDGSEFYQRFFLALILEAAQARSTLKPSEKLPVYCYLDECQWVRNDQKLATILDECRSQKIALILAHQRTDQITNPNVLSAMSNCAIRFANSDDEAKYLAPKLRCEPEFLYSLPRGTFAAFVRDLTPNAIALKVPYRDIEDLPRMTAAQQAAIRQRMRDEYGIIPASPPIHSAISSYSTREAQANATDSGDEPQSVPTRRDDLPPASDKPETGSTW